MKRNLLILAIFLTLIINLCGCSAKAESQNSLVGKWETINNDSAIATYTAIEFTDDGKYTNYLCLLDRSAWEKIIYNYSTENGMLHLKSIESWTNGVYSKDESYDSESYYSINGDTLKIGNVEYKRVDKFKYQYQETIKQ